jgi:hypothetical protein
MPGDYSRISDKPPKRFSALFIQQGRVQLDADWNESVDILRRRIREQANDVFGQAAVPQATTPDAFAISYTAGSGGAPDLVIAPGRLYVDGILAECFVNEAITPVTYSQQPFWPNPTPALASLTGSALVYLDVWEREITAIEDPSIVDSALNGIDTGTRLQAVWQVKLMAPPAGSSTISCLSDFSSLFPPSGCRLSTQTVPPAQAPDPCQIAASGGYQGIDNRLYRVEVHDVSQGAPLFKWSRDNGSVATTVLTLANTAGTGSSLGSAQITVVSVGRDDDLSFHADDWVEITDDLHELSGEAGIMANITAVVASSNTLTLDRSLAGGNFNPALHAVRLRRWDQTQGLFKSTGLVQAEANTWLALENGIQVELNVVAGGAAKVGDAWVFAARVSTGLVDVLQAAPPIAIQHHYCSLATLTGLGSGTVPAPTSCRTLWPTLGTDGSCACTVCVDAAAHNSGTATIQQAIGQVSKTGGVVCLGPGTFVLGATPVAIASAASVELRGTGPATVLASNAPAALAINDAVNIAVSDLAIQCAAVAVGNNPPPPVLAGISVDDVLGVTIERCVIGAAIAFAGAAPVTTGPTTNPAGAPVSIGVGINLAGFVGAASIRDNSIVADYGLVSYDPGTVAGKATGFVAGDSASQAQAAFSDLEIADNLFLTSLAAITMGSAIAISDTRINGNSIVSGVDGIMFYAVAPVDPLRIVGNDIGAGNQGLLIGCDNSEIFDNLIVGPGSTPSPPAGGIGIEASPSLGSVRCAIERNRISGYIGGVAIQFNTAASRLTIRGNSIGDVDSGIVMSSNASATDLVIEANEISSVGAVSTATTLPNGFAGIVVGGAGRAVVRNNTLLNIGAANSSGSAQIVGIQIVNSTTVSVVENEIGALGSTSSATATTYGIWVTPPFDDVRVIGNRIGLVQPVSANSRVGPYSAIAVYRWTELGAAVLNLSSLASVLNLRPMTDLAPAAASRIVEDRAAAAAGTAAPAPAPAPTPAAAPIAAATTAAALAAAGKQRVLLSAIGNQLLTTTPDFTPSDTAGQQNAEVSGNVVDVVPSNSPLIRVEVSGACTLAGNRVAFVGSPSLTKPVQLPSGISSASAIVAQAAALVASNNFVNAYSGVAGIVISASNSGIAIGNLCTTGITYQGVLVGNWNTVNNGGA